MTAGRSASTRAVITVVSVGVAWGFGEDTGSVQVQEVFHEFSDCPPLLFSDRSDPVPETIAIQRDYLEYKGNALVIKAIVGGRCDGIGMRESGSTERGRQRHNNSEIVCTSHHDCRACPPLLMPFRIGQINQPDVSCFHPSVLEGTQGCSLPDASLLFQLCEVLLSGLKEELFCLRDTDRNLGL